MDTSQSAVIKRLTFKMCRVFQTLMGKAPVEYPPPATLQKRTKKIQVIQWGKKLKILSKVTFSCSLCCPHNSSSKNRSEGHTKKDVLT